MQVLDKGSIELLGVFGNDLMVTNTARVSFAKESASFSEKDEKLVKYLASHKHFSPFYHPRLQWRVKAPISVHRQWERHRIGTDMNSESTRYVEVAEEFYLPREMRAQSTSNKQGSSGALDKLIYLDPTEDGWAKSERSWFNDWFQLSRNLPADLPPDQEAEAGTAHDAGQFAESVYKESCEQAFQSYRQLISLGVAKEQAREVLPLCTYVSWIWTASLFAVSHFIKLRDEEHAQWEVRQYAKAMRLLTEEHFPVSLKALLEV